MNSICLYKPRPRCEFKKRGRCTKYVDRPIPMGHIGGQIIPVGIIGGLVDSINPGKNAVLVPRCDWSDGCCEYIKERGEIIRSVPKKKRASFVHNLSAYEHFIKARFEI